ncbi:MAG: Uma2 family endonuclease [Solirubrobacteraceae bacterium]
MPTLVNDPQPVELAELIERRRALGQDKLDEVWEGVYHMNPVPHASHAYVAQQLAEILTAPAREVGLVPILSQVNLGESHNYRVPDGALFRTRPDAVFVPTAALVVEIVSPGDQTWEKLGFYAAHRVDEFLIVDKQERQIHWLGLADGEYQPIAACGLIKLGPEELAARIDWP